MEHGTCHILKSTIWTIWLRFSFTSFFYALKWRRFDWIVLCCFILITIPFFFFFCSRGNSSTFEWIMHWHNTIVWSINFIHWNLHSFAIIAQSISKQWIIRKQWTFILLGQEKIPFKIKKNSPFATKLAMVIW